MPARHDKSGFQWAAPLLPEQQLEPEQRMARYSAAADARGRLGRARTGIQAFGQDLLAAMLRRTPLCYP